MSDPGAPVVANHHAHHPGFSGVRGAVHGLLMILRRRETARLVVDLAGTSATDRIVDVGCGPGAAARLAARRGARVTGIDPAPVMLSVARALTWRSGLEWRLGKAESLPLPDSSFSVWWSVAAVHHWTDVGKGMAEAYRVLSPGGRALAIERRVSPGTTGKASHGWTDDQASVFADTCRAVGFATVGVEVHNADNQAILVVSSVKS